MSEQPIIPREVVSALTPDPRKPYRNRQTHWYEADDPVGYQLLASVAEALYRHLQDRYTTGRGLTHWLRVSAPYCFAELRNGELLPLNREYKPLGLSDYFVTVDYERYRPQAIPATRIDTEMTRRIPHGEGVQFFLYNDLTPPWYGIRDARVYLARLRLLLGHDEPAKQEAAV